MHFSSLESNEQYVMTMNNMLTIAFLSHLTSTYLYIEKKYAQY